MIRTIRTIIGMELRLNIARSANAASVISFFLIAVMFFPLAIGPEEETLMLIGSGVIWTAALFATLLPLSSLFQRDFADGTLEQYTMLSVPMECVIFSKCAAHWLVAGLPLVILSPVLAHMLFIPAEKILLLMLSLALGTLTLTAISAVGAALITGNQRAGMILTVLLMPLYIPVLIFGSSVTTRTQEIASPIELYILGGFVLILVPISVWLIAKLLRWSME